MSSIDIVADTRLVIQNKLLPSVPSRWRGQLSFGLEAFTLRPFQSAGSNARSVVTNTNTAASKVRRLLGNKKLADCFGTAFDQLNLAKPGSYVNVDHSDFDGLTALVGAIQTRNGRAIPCMVETTYALHIPAHEDASPRQKELRTDMLFARASQSFTGHTIDALQGLADRWGFWPKLVFDRGFANESIVEHLQAGGATFYIRLKAGNYVEADGQRTNIKVQDLSQKDATIELFGMTLRVIRSPKSRRAPEPWYILTNDFSSSRNKVIKIYYHRFEIEETFKDTKHLFELKRLKFGRPNSLRVVLWLVFLGIALLYAVTKPMKQQQHSVNPKKWCSWIRVAYEQFQRALTQLRALTGLTPRYGGMA